MSSSVAESIVAALVTALNTGRPAGVPVFESDRWVDVEAGPSTLPCAVVVGFEDEPETEQDRNRYLDFRGLKLHFEIYAAPASPKSARQVADEAAQWIATKCGPELASSLVGAGAISAEFGKRVAVVVKGNLCRCAIEVTVRYRNLINDITRTR